MWLIALEAGFALLALIFIVWWTMFSGRNPDNPHDQSQRASSEQEHSDPQA
jgi:hypothetical protein